MVGAAIHSNVLIVDGVHQVSATRPYPRPSLSRHGRSLKSAGSKPRALSLDSTMIIYHDHG